MTAPASGTYTIVHHGVRRTYQLRIPPTYDPKRPSRLVLVFHGWGGDEDEFLSDSTVTSESDRRGYIVVAPRGLGSGEPDNSNNSWSFRGSATGVIANRHKQTPVCDGSVTPDYRYPSCRQGTAKNSCSWTQCQDDDVEFVQHLISRLKTLLCIDAHHVYASGGSNGGMFSWELGQDPKTAGLFRAIAPIIGLPHRGDLRLPARKGGLPVLLITGTADTTVPPGAWDDAAYTTTSNQHDRFFYTGATAIVQRWSTAVGCSTAHHERPFETGAGFIDCRSYCGTRGPKWPAVLDCRAPMGHDYGLTQTWKLILDFFDRE